MVCAYPYSAISGRQTIAKNRFMKNIAFIINPMSGTQNKRRMPKLIMELLDKSQWLENIVFSQQATQTTSLAKQYAMMGFDAVVAIGGDGTVHDVAEGIAGTHTALGIIPMGLTNTLARHLGIPLRGNTAISWLNRSEPLQCDTLSIQIDDKPAMVALCGLKAGDERVVNCAHGMKTSIQDGIAEVSDGSILKAGESLQIGSNGSVMIDGDEYAAEQSVRVSILPDNLYILAPKRF